MRNTPCETRICSRGGITSSCSSSPNHSPRTSARIGNSTGRNTGKRRTNGEQGCVQHSRSASGTGRRNSGVGSGGPCGEDPAAAMAPSQGPRESPMGGRRVITIIITTSITSISSRGWGRSTGARAGPRTRTPGRVRVVARRRPSSSRTGAGRARSLGGAAARPRRRGIRVSGGGS